MTRMFDSDTLNYAVKGNPVVMDRYRAMVAAGATFVLCPMVEYEVVRYLRLRWMRHYQRALEDFVAHWQRAVFDQATFDMAVDLWVERHKAGHPVADADLLIAVTAIQNDAVLVTNNTSHFESLGLTLETWTR
jgi:predicted nucleic acid-binding protein